MNNPRTKRNLDFPNLGHSKWINHFLKEHKLPSERQLDRRSFYTFPDRSVYADISPDTEGSRAPCSALLRLSWSFHTSWPWTARPACSGTPCALSKQDLYLMIKKQVQCLWKIYSWNTPLSEASGSMSGTQGSQLSYERTDRRRDRQTDARADIQRYLDNNNLSCSLSQFTVLSFILPGS